jgi:hypothetical protein
LEKKKRQLLESIKAEWRLKSCAIWLENGDENTKKFQAYAKGRKMSNTIWSLSDNNGNVVTSFEYLANLGRRHLQSLFKEDNQTTIADVVRMAVFFHAL